MAYSGKDIENALWYWVGVEDGRKLFIIFPGIEFLYEKQDVLAAYRRRDDLRFTPDEFRKLMDDAFLMEFSLRDLL